MKFCEEVSVGLVDKDNFQKYQTGMTDSKNSDASWEKEEESNSKAQAVNLLRKLQSDIAEKN